MKHLLLISVLSTLTVLCIVCDAHDLDKLDESLDSQWARFKRTYNRKYDENGNEEAKRRLIFKKNLAKITDHNQRAYMGEFSYHLGINRFSDMTAEEVTFDVMGSNNDATNEGEDEDDEIPDVDPSTLPLPATLDCRRDGVVTPVKDQGDCTADWAFAFLGAMEGQLPELHKRKWTSLSAQQLLDCSNGYGNKGCRSGSVGNANKYAAKFGIQIESHYPFKGVRGRCTLNQTLGGYKTTKKVIASRGNLTTLQHALRTHGPVTAVIKPCTENIYRYKVGTFTDTYCPKAKAINLLVVGYRPQYFMVKTSFGKKFGQRGYINIARDENDALGLGRSVKAITIQREE